MLTGGNAMERNIMGLNKYLGLTLVKAATCNAMERNSQVLKRVNLSFLKP